MKAPHLGQGFISSAANVPTLPPCEDLLQTTKCKLHPIKSDSLAHTEKFLTLRIGLMAVANRS